MNKIKLFDITDLAISELKDRYMGLSIKDLDDKEGFSKVRSARLVMKGYRVDVEKRRKELNEDALKHQRTINSEAKIIIEQLASIEDYLFTQEEDFKIKLEEIKRKEEEEISKRRLFRITKMISIGFTFNGEEFINEESTQHDNKLIQSLIDEEFDGLFFLLKKEYDYKLEIKRIEKEKSDLILSEQLAIREAEYQNSQKILAEERAKNELAQEIERKKLHEQAIFLAQKEKELKEESDRISLKKYESTTIIPNVETVKIQSKNYELKSYKVEINGQFKARYECSSENSEKAKNIALTLLNNIESDLFLSFEKENCQSHEFK